jgi:tetratricopeptide (TPR) repeat protein
MKLYALFSILTCTSPAQDASDFPKLVDEAHALVAKEDWTGAVPKYEQAVKLNPYSQDAWAELGEAQYHLKHYPEAITAYKRANLGGQGLKGVTEYNLACCLALSGDKKGAIDTLESALRHGYRDLASARTDTDLTSIRSDPKVADLLYLQDVSKMDRIEGWRYDLKVAWGEIQRLHFNPFTKNSRRTFEDAVRKLDREIPKLDDSHILTRMAQIVALCGDGHTAVRFPQDGTKTKLSPRYLPVSLQAFPDGVFIVAGAPKAKEWVGKRVIKVGGKPVGDAITKVITCSGCDNVFFAQFLGGRALQSAHLLAGLGFADSASRVTITVEDANGKPQDVTFDSGSERSGADWISAADPDHPPFYLKQKKPHWTEALPEQKTLYVAYQAVQDQPGQTVREFWTKAFDQFDSLGAERMIIDMRSNGGGNNFLNLPMLAGILARPKLNQRGKLFVITSPATYSAAICGAGQLDRFTNIMFVGMPPGAPPNFIGETVPVALPYSGLMLSMSDLYWQNSHAMDRRQWIAPDIAVEPTFSELKAGHDPCMEAIEKYLAGISDYGLKS